MDIEQFVNRVIEHCPDLDPAVAHDVCVITTRTLCEYLTQDQTERMASQVPAALAEGARAGAAEQVAPSDRVELDEFYDKIASRAETSGAATEQVGRAVTQTLWELLSAGEAVDVLFELPPDLDRLMQP